MNSVYDVIRVLAPFFIFGSPFMDLLFYWGTRFMLAKGQPPPGFKPIDHLVWLVKTNRSDRMRCMAVFFLLLALTAVTGFHHILWALWLSMVISCLIMHRHLQFMKHWLANHPTP